MALAAQEIYNDSANEKILPGYAEDYDMYSPVEGGFLPVDGGGGGGGGGGVSANVGNTYSIYFDSLYIILSNNSVSTTDNANSILSFKIYYKNVVVNGYNGTANTYEYERREIEEPDTRNLPAYDINSDLYWLNVNVSLFNVNTNKTVSINSSMNLLSAPMVQSGTSDEISQKIDFYKANSTTYPPGTYKIQVSFSTTINNYHYESALVKSSDFTLESATTQTETVINPIYEIKGVVNNMEVLPDENGVILPKIYLSGGLIQVNDIDNYTISIEETTSGKVSFSSNSEFSTSISTRIHYDDENESLTSGYRNVYIKNENSSSGVISAKIKIKAEGISYPLKVNENTTVKEVDKEFIFVIKLLGNENGEEPELSKISFSETSIPNQKSISGKITNGTRNIVKITSAALANNYDLSIKANDGNLKEYDISIKNVYTGYVSKKVTITFNIFYSDSSSPEILSYDFTLLPRLEDNKFLIKITVYGKVDAEGNYRYEDGTGDFIINNFTFE